MYKQLLGLYDSNRREGNLLFLMLAAFLTIYFVPAGSARFDNAILEAVRLTHWYAREHVILCLLPAFLIAGAMAVYISQGAVMRYLGPDASKPVAFSVASVSGALLAVCSCTVLPLFGGIYKRGAGLGAAIAFLYSGPAINVMAVVMMAKVLGAEIGIARAVGAILFALVIGTIMHLLYRRRGTDGGRHGQGAGVGSVAGGSGSVTAQYAGDSHHSGQRENTGLLCTGCGDGYHHRFDIWQRLACLSRSG